MEKDVFIVVFIKFKIYIICIKYVYMCVREMILNFSDIVNVLYLNMNW